MSRTYDALGRLTGESGSGGATVAASKSIGLDIVGRVTSISHPGGTETFTYDDRGLMLSAAGPTGSATT